ncbi:MAG: ABC transporter permease [Microbacterium sp.]
MTVVDRDLADPGVSLPPEPAPAARGERGHRLRVAWSRTWPVLAALGGILAGWYAVSYLVLPESRQFLLPPPHEVYPSAFSNANLIGPMLSALGLTAEVALLGILFAIVIGIGWATVMSLTPWAERILYPYAVILQTIPILALVPLIGIWFSYGIPSRVIVCVIVAVFPMISNTLFGLQSASPQAHDLFTLNKATRMQRLAKLQFPAAVPAIFTGLRNVAGLSVIGAIVGDFYFQQGPVGIGGLLRTYTTRLQMDGLLTAITLTAVFGVLVFTLFAVIDRAIVGRWYGRAGK